MKNTAFIFCALFLLMPVAGFTQDGGYEGLISPPASSSPSANTPDAQDGGGYDGLVSWKRAPSSAPAFQNQEAPAEDLYEYIGTSGMTSAEKQQRAAEKSAEKSMEMSASNMRAAQAAEFRRQVKQNRTQYEEDMQRQKQVLQLDSRETRRAARNLQIKTR